MENVSQSIAGFYAESVPDLSALFSEDNNDDIPMVSDSDVSSQEYSDNDVSSIDSFTTQEHVVTNEEPVKKLKWEFYGLTLWIELEEYDLDLTTAVEDLAYKFNLELIPKCHMTAIYGMTHLTIDQAKEKLQAVKDVIPTWPDFAPPTGVVSDIAVCGRPGQVCDVAWCELTLSSNDAHEEALNKLYSLFHDSSNTSWNRCKPWKPHSSIAYDNPENKEFSLGDLVQYVAQHPSLITRERRVEAISLWDTNGKMEDWKCLDRVYF